MLTKDKVIERVKKLPKEFSLDELIEELVVVEKIEKGLEQSAKNEVISDEDLDKEIDKWFK